MTPIRIMKWAIALLPIGAIALGRAKNEGPAAAGDSLIAAYTGYSFQAKDFQWQRLLPGYVPLLGAYVFGKIASRILR